jgi:hypothetical protein
MIHLRRRVRRRLLWGVASACLCGLSLAAGSVRGAEVAAFPTGQIIDAVACLSDASQTYALYLPSTYTPDRAWPILYAFDPRARGRYPVELFRDAAEKHGYIVVGSNNSRNGPAEPVLRAVRAVWEDTQVRFKIDMRRIYTAGMSGSTTPAWMLASQVGAGVVASGGPMIVEEADLAKVKFAYFAVAGDWDFNFGPMQAIARGVERAGQPARFETFAGGHRWPPAALCGEALEWLELLAIKQGRRPIDDAFVAEQLEKALTRARSLEATDPLKAYRTFRALVQDFRGLRPIEEFERKTRELAQSDAVKKGEREEREIEERDNRETQTLVDLVQAIEEPNSGARSTLGRQTASRPNWDALPGEPPRGALNRALQELNRRAEQGSEGSKPTPDTIVARRVREGFWIFCMERARDAGAAGRTEAAALDLELANEGATKVAWLRYELSKALAADKQKKKALVALAEAVKLGFSDAQAIEGEKAFDALRGEREYATLVAGLRSAH